MSVTNKLHWADILVIILYFVIGVGLWSSLRNRGSVSGYFLAGRNMHWSLVGASLFASNIGSGHFIGLAGSGAATGIGIAVFELNAIFILIILGWLFVPVYIAAGVYTMPEYLRKRFGGDRIRIYLAVLALLLYVFTKISADLFAGAIFIKAALDLDLYVAVIILLIIAALFTIGGGLTAVIWTDAIQTVIMIIGAIVLMILSFIRAGGYTRIVNDFFVAWPNTTTKGNVSYAQCGKPPANYMKLLRSADDPDLPWPGVVFGLTISSIWYWCSDQVIVQRALAAKNLSHAKAGALMAGYLKFLPLWLIVFPGMISRILYKDTVGCIDKTICSKYCNSEQGCTNMAYPALVLDVMPIALKGLMMAVMMSALVSSLTSIFNSSSTIFTMDIWRKIRPRSTDAELMIVGRVCVLALVAISIVWIPVVQNVKELFHYIQAITSFLAPPVCAVYILAIFWKRVNEKGAFFGLMVGLVVGMTRFIWEYSYSVPPCADQAADPRPAIIKDVHYLHFGCILFVIVLITTITISLLTKPIDEKHLVRLTFWSRYMMTSHIDLSVIDGVGSREVLSSPYAVESASVTTQSTTSVANQTDEPPPTPCWKKSIQWICGIERMQTAPKPMSEQTRIRLEQIQTDISEEPFWQRVCNINAIILIATATFFFVFYSL